MTTGIIWDRRFLDHNLGLAIVSAPIDDAILWDPLPHAASPQLVERAYGLIGRSGLLAHLTAIPCEPASLTAIARVHTNDLINRVRETSEQGGDCGVYAPASPQTYEVARLAVGGAIAAVDAVMAGIVNNAYALLRPPGHHAEPDQAMGFCYFNNVAIAARYIQENYGLGKIAIVDWDVHHGNGTQAAFYDDPSVLFISLHQQDWYPADSGRVEDVGTASGEGFTVNVPMPPGTGNAGYLSAFERIILPALQTFAPEFILVSAGQDPSGVDPLGRMAMSAIGFRQLAEKIQSAADHLCNGRLVACHEGGYSEGYSPVCTWAVIEGLSGIRTGIDDPYDEWLGNIEAATEVGPAAEYIDRAVETHRAMWNLV